MPNYRALVAGGYYSANPQSLQIDPKTGKRVAVSIRMNNPGAVNGAAWETALPGYVDTIETTPGNKTTIFEAPEYGVAAWYILMTKYAAKDVHTINGIVTRYGGGQDYSAYVKAVTEKSGLPAGYEVALDGDDANLIKFARAMFEVEAGRTSPLSDAQIEFGFALGRQLLRANGRNLVVGVGAVVAGGAIAVQQMGANGVNPSLIAAALAGIVVIGIIVYLVLHKFKGSD